MDKTPRANRLHIGIYGRRNTGKSSLINRLTDQETSLVSEYAGTTTDPVYKNMELHGLGPVVFIDTAGFDDEGDLGELRVEKTRKSMEKCDLALFLISMEHVDEDLSWIKELKAYEIQVIPILSKVDESGKALADLSKVEEKLQQPVLKISAKENIGIKELLEEIQKAARTQEERTITGSLVKKHMLVMLVMPQDIQAPKGRLILAQVQVIRELLDKKAVVLSVTLEQFKQGLGYLNQAPDLIITDSQVFEEVYKMKPEGALLTSFSILFAGYKGDMNYFVESTKVFKDLTENSKILIAEACAHPPLEEDIGRVKIPLMLRKKYGEHLHIDFVRGDDFPKALEDYDLIIHCGACMFNRKHVLSRLNQAKMKQVPMTNYGVTIAYLKGILDKVVFKD